MTPEEFENGPFGDTPYPLGRKVNHDERSRSFPAPRAAERKPVLHRRYSPVLDQGTLGSCTGNAMAHAINMTPLHIPGKPWLNQRDAVALYQRATAIDPFPGIYPPSDTGSDGLSVCKAAQEKGLITGYRWAFGFEHVLDALQLGPVLIGTWWYDSMFSPDGKGFVGAKGDRVGGHEYVLMGDDRKGKLTFLNSWGPSWGKKGRFHMDYATFAALLRDQGDAAVPVRA
jgi:hypothetical protein